MRETPRPIFARAQMNRSTRNTHHERTSPVKPWETKPPKEDRKGFDAFRHAVERDGSAELRTRIEELAFALKTEQTERRKLERQLYQKIADISAEVDQLKRNNFVNHDPPKVQVVDEFDADLRLSSDEWTTFQDTLKNPPAVPDWLRKAVLAK